MVVTTRRKAKAARRDEEDESDQIEEEEPSLDKLQQVQDELEQVKEEASDKMLQLERKYKDKWRSVYRKRNKIIKSIPDFWLKAFLSHPALCDLLNEEDQKIFKYLSSLDVEEYKNVNSTYSISFNFNQNPYFEDASLIKTFSVSDEGITEIAGTKINWKEGMDVANGGNHEQKGRKRSFVDESFFTWFNDTQHENSAEGIHDEVAEIIKEDLWPNPIRYLNKKVTDEEDSEEDEDDKDSEGDKADEEYVNNDISNNLAVATNSVRSRKKVRVKPSCGAVVSHKDVRMKPSCDALSIDVAHLFQTDQIFDSRDHIIQWCQEIGKQNKIVVVIIKSQKSIPGKKRARLTLGCERGGFFRNHKKKSEQLKETPEQRRKVVGTKKCGCPFALKGVWFPGDKWKLEVQCGEHNHELSIGNSYVGRLKEDERQLLIEMTKTGVRPRQVLTSIKQKSQGNLSTMRTIYNARARLRLADVERTCAMQQVMKLLSEHHYVEWHRLDTETNEVKDILWAHPESLQLAKCFPSVIVVDCTYKTKRYRMPLFEIVGFTSTGKTFTIAFVVMEAETEAHYTWALSCLKTIFDPDAQPSVFVTDRENALTNAISEVFPDANRLLCTHQISKNVLSNCKKHFQKNEDLEMFLKEWTDVTQAQTHIEFYDGFAKFEQKWASYPDSLRYLRETWLDQKEHFVLSWTNLVKHYGITTTSQAKRAHAELKQHLRTSKRNFTSCWMAMHRMIVGEVIAVKASFEKSLTVLQQLHNLPAFEELRGSISHQALDLLLIEHSRGTDVDVDDNAACQCVLHSTHGLPCAHEIAGFVCAGQSIPLSEIDPHWRKLTTVPTLKQHQDADYLPEWNLFKKKWEVSTEKERLSMWRKFKEIASPTMALMQEPHKEIASPTMTLMEDPHMEIASPTMTWMQPNKEIDSTRTAIQETHKEIASPTRTLMDEFDKEIASPTRTLVQEPHKEIVSPSRTLMLEFDKEIASSTRTPIQQPHEEIASPTRTLMREPLKEVDLPAMISEPYKEINSLAMTSMQEPHKETDSPMQEPPKEIDLPATSSMQDPSKEINSSAVTPELHKEIDLPAMTSEPHMEIDSPAMTSRPQKEIDAPAMTSEPQKEIGAPAMTSDPQKEIDSPAMTSEPHMEIDSPAMTSEPQKQIDAPAMTSVQEDQKDFASPNLTLLQEPQKDQ